MAGANATQFMGVSTSWVFGNAYIMRGLEAEMRVLELGKRRERGLFGRN